MLRTVAIACVLFAHLAYALGAPETVLGYGRAGVGLFFVHTSLVLMWSLERRPNTVDFYIRRIFRVYPLSIAAILAALVTRAPVEALGRNGRYFLYSAPSWKQIVTHLLLVQDMFSGTLVLYPIWTLPFELQMYLLLPALFFFLRAHRALAPLLTFWLLAFAFAHKYFSPMDLNLASAIPFFLPGVMAYVGFARRRPLLPGWSFPLLLAAVVFLNSHLNDWRRSALPCLALGLVLPFFKQIGRGPVAKTSWYVARYSYGMYLLHPFAFVLGIYLLRGHSLPLQMTVVFSSLFALCLAAYHGLEAPFIRIGGRIATRIADRPFAY